MKRQYLVIWSETCWLEPGRCGNIFTAASLCKDALKVSQHKNTRYPSRNRVACLFFCFSFLILCVYRKKQRQPWCTPGAHVGIGF